VSKLTQGPYKLVNSRWHQTHESIIARVIPVTESGCWLWLGSTDGRYGEFWFEGKKIKAHVFAFIMYFGTVPVGMEVCHSCDVELCVNPLHLFAATHSENMKDARRKGRQPIPSELGRTDALTHCHKGHPWTEENIKRRKDGYKECRTCANVSQRQYHQRVKNDQAQQAAKGE
jgi:hypothetical protein